MKFNVETNTPVYITISEEWYGGAAGRLHDGRPTPLRCFTTKEDAEVFAHTYGTKYNVDVVVVETNEVSIYGDTNDGEFQ